MHAVPKSPVTFRRASAIGCWAAPSARVAAVLVLGPQYPPGRPAGFRIGRALRRKRTTERRRVRLCLIARSPHGARHHGPALAHGHSSRRRRTGLFGDRLQRFSMDALRLARRCPPGARCPPRTGRESGGQLFWIRERSSAQCAHVSSRWPRVSRLSPVVAAGGPRTCASRWATDRLSSLAHGHGSHEKGCAAVVCGPRARCAKHLLPLLLGVYPE